MPREIIKPKPLRRPNREVLGKAARTLLPIQKLKETSPRGVPFEKELHDFLFTNFNGYTVSSGSISGHWADDSGHDHYGEHRQYSVALPNEESIRSLEVFLATLAADLDEECIYFETAGEISLIYRMSS